MFVGSLTHFLITQLPTPSLIEQQAISFPGASPPLSCLCQETLARTAMSALTPVSKPSFNTSETEQMSPRSSASSMVLRRSPRIAAQALSLQACPPDADDVLTAGAESGSGSSSSSSLSVGGSRLRNRGNKGEIRRETLGGNKGREGFPSLSPPLSPSQSSHTTSPSAALSVLPLSPSTSSSASSSSSSLSAPAASILSSISPTSPGSGSALSMMMSNSSLSHQGVAKTIITTPLPVPPFPLSSASPSSLSSASAAQALGAEPQQPALRLPYSVIHGDRYYSWEEIQAHNTFRSCWLVVKNEVFDVTSFLDDHPAGK